MLDKIKNIFSRGTDKTKEGLSTAKVIPKAIVEATKEEIKEIKDLNLTEVDQLQGEVIASVAITAMSAMGIPASATMREIIKTSAAYTLRDFKEGYTNPEKLIVTRVLNKIKELRDAKAIQNTK